MSTIFDCTKLLLSDNKCDGLSVASIKQNVNFKIEPPSMFLFFYFAKVILLKNFLPLKIYQHTRFHGTILTGPSYACISEI
jgi:hypothetical protein